MCLALWAHYVRPNRQSCRFVTFRVVHSLIHCGYNKVEHRFAAYMLAAIGLWVMVIRSALSLFGLS